MPTTSPWALTSGPPELPGLMAASVWMNWPGERRSAANGIGTVQRADDAARHGEAKSQRIAECEYGLAGMQLRGISQRHAGQVGSVDLDDGKIGERIGTDQLRREDSAIGHGNANVHRTVDDVVVGHDVAIGRNNDTAAQTVLNVGLRSHVLAKAVGQN